MQERSAKEAIGDMRAILRLDAMGAPDLEIRQSAHASLDMVNRLLSAEGSKSIPELGIG
jgi:hypothetical protein